MAITPGLTIEAADVLKLGAGIFGDGSDGVIVTAGGGAGDVTLARDMFYDDLTVTAGDTITTDGYRIFVKGTLTNNGVIENNGLDGVANAIGPGGGAGSIGEKNDGGFAGSTGGGGGGGAGSVLLIVANILDNSGGTIECNGGDGGNAPGGSAVQGNGAAGGSTAQGFGGAGGIGGDGGGATGGAAGTVTAPAASYGGWRALPEAILLHRRDNGSLIGGGAGGGGGAGDNAPDESGGGGGGGGGFIMLIYNIFTSGTEQCLLGSGGTAFGGGGATAGTNGVAGAVLQIDNSGQ